jgi:hypothetical protein
MINYDPKDNQSEAGRDFYFGFVPKTDDDEKTFDQTPPYSREITPASQRIIDEEEKKEQEKINGKHY